MAYRIEHQRAGCIACAACAITAPDFWEMSTEDGKSDLKESRKTLEGGETVLEQREIEQKDFEANKQAADMCPVNVIHIIRKDGEKII